MFSQWQSFFGIPEQLRKSCRKNPSENLLGVSSSELGEANNTDNFPLLLEGNRYSDGYIRNQIDSEKISTKSNWSLELIIHIIAFTVMMNEKIFSLKPFSDTVINLCNYARKANPLHKKAIVRHFF